MCCWGVFLGIQIVVYRSSHQSTPSANKVAVSEMGRKSLVMSLGTLFLGTGLTSAFFHTAGTDACWMEALKIEVTGGPSRGA
jgi:hypothetical protein